MFLASSFLFGYDISWTARIIPNDLDVCKGSTISFTFVEEVFTASGLPQGEYVQQILKQYRWRIGDNTLLEGTQCSINTANNFEIGTYSVTLEGTVNYLIKWTEGDVEQEEGPFQIDWKPLASTQFTVKDNSYNWKAATTIGVVSDLELMSGELLKKVVESIGRLLPGVVLKMKSVSLLYSQHKRDCCFDGESIQDGEIEKTASCSTTLSIYGNAIAIISALMGSPIPTTHCISLTVPGGEIEVNYTFDLVLSASPSITGVIGKRESVCNLDSQCTFASSVLAYTIGITPTIEAIVCINSAFLDDCAGVVINPVYSNIAFGINVGYNMKDCVEGWKCRASIGEISLGFQFKILTVDLTKEIQLFKGVSF